MNKKNALRALRKKARDTRAKERINDALRARKFTAAQTLEMGMKLTDFAREFTQVGNNL